MKLRGPIFLSVAALTFIFAAFYPKAINNPEKESVIMQTLLTFVNQLHYSPKAINDEFSAELFDFYLDNIDGGKRFFTQVDIDQLSAFKVRLDDEAKMGSFGFFDQSLELLETGIEKAKTSYKEILAQPFDFNREEYFELDYEKRPFAKDDAELREYWRKSLKYDVLTRVNRRLEQQKDKGEEAEKKSVETLELEARQELEETYDDYFGRVAKIKREDRLTGYLNSITQLFDPHSGYYKPIDKENYDIRFTGQYEGIGARLIQDGDFTRVTEVMAGGPAWKSKELRDGDLFLKVAQGDDEEWTDIAGWTTNDVVQKIRGKKGTKVRLMIRSTDGTEKEISLIRDKIKTEETFAKSLILDGPNNEERIGYIFLPSFYANFKDPNGRFSGKDVAKEVEKLKAENVDGIILDLRNNGGGSLTDVIRMTGLFIEEGPVVQVKASRREPEVYRDVDSQVQYDGPLAVMTNNFSASASEILVAALQDYNRAVIVGSKSTFGKGSVQRFFDMDRIGRINEDLKPLGNVKITTQKFYRINGGSNQLRGVIPDIILPDNFSEIEKVGEKQENYPLSWTEIEPVEHSQNVYQIKNMDKLRKKSKERISKDKSFVMVAGNAKRLAKNREMTYVPLSLKAYQEFYTQRNDEARQYKDMFKNVKLPGTHNLDADLDFIKENEKNEALNENFIEVTSKDPYIKETLNIVHDLIKIN